VITYYNYTTIRDLKSPSTTVLPPCECTKDSIIQLLSQWWIFYPKPKYKKVQIATKKF